MGGKAPGAGGGLTVAAGQYPRFRRDPTAGWEPRPGRRVAEPFAYLEDPDSAETQAFVREQNALAQTVLEQCPARGPYRELMTQIMDYPKQSAPRRRGDRFFYTFNTGLQAQSVLYSTPSPEEKGAVLLDPNTFSDDGTIALGSTATTRDGKLMAYTTSSGGSDWVEVSVIEISETGEAVKLDDHLKWVKFTSLAWTHDKKGFFYNRYPEPEGLKGEAGTETDSNQKNMLFYHRLGNDQKDDVLLWEATEDPTWMMNAEVSDCGRFLMLCVVFGCDPMNKLYYVELEADGSFPADPRIVKVVDTFDAEYEYVANEGKSFVFRTNLNAPRYKLVRVEDITDPALHGRPEAWEVLLDEEGGGGGRDVLEWAAALEGDALVACYLKDAHHVLQLRSLATGALVKQFDELPIGSVAGFTGDRDSSECWMKLSGFTTPGAIYRLDTRAGAAAQPILFKRTEIKSGGYPAEDIVAKQVFVPSKDGTQVPMFIIGPKAKVAERTAPPGAAVLYGYGGFNISLTPGFSASRMAWMLGFDAVYAVANLRGGGEYGEEWHRAGTGMQKQNVFDDFIACAEYLKREGYAAEDKLAIEGGSNGGTLVGACLNQRPDLYAAGIAHVGVMDMLKFHKFTIGHAWVSDFGNPEESDEMFDYISSYSPLHNVPASGTYPSTMVLTGDHDDRVVPLHSHKFIAQLQYRVVVQPHENGEAILQTNPLIARIDTRAGHGAGKPTQKVIEQCADVYSFCAAATSTAWVAPPKPESKM